MYVLESGVGTGASAPNFDWGGGSHRSHTDNVTSFLEQLHLQ